MILHHQIKRFEYCLFQYPVLHCLVSFLGHLYFSHQMVLINGHQQILELEDIPHFLLVILKSQSNHRFELMYVSHTTSIIIC